MDLAAEIYGLCELLPSSERFGLSQQLRRAAVSVISNIAEGHERRPPRVTGSDFRNFLSIARGSAAEIEAQLLLAERLQFVPADRVERAMKLIRQTSRLLTALHRSLA